MGFNGVDPKSTGRPAYHPSVLLKIYVYGYLNRIASSRRLERETQRNIEMMWLTGRLMPDFKTIANFRKENAKALRGVCQEFVVLCRNLDLFADALVAIDSSKFKAVNNRDRNFTVAKMKRRQEQIEGSIDRYMKALDTADLQEPEIAEARKTRLTEKIKGLKEQMERLKQLEEEMLKTKAKGRFGKQDFVYLPDKDVYRCPAGELMNRRFQCYQDGKTFHCYATTACPTCRLQAKCTTGPPWRRIKRWEHEDVLDTVQRRLDLDPEKMAVRRCTAEHPFGTLKSWMGATHFLTRTKERVSAEMSLHVLAYNMKRMIKILGIGPLLEAIRTHRETLMALLVAAMASMGRIGQFLALIAITTPKSAPG